VLPPSGIHDRIFAKQYGTDKIKGRINPIVIRNFRGEWRCTENVSKSA
jgi:hypothetical protein